jgi:hypothetical protein
MNLVKNTQANLQQVGKQELKMKKIKCKTKNCNNMITGLGKTGMCASCAKKGKNHPNYATNKYNITKKYLILKYKINNIPMFKIAKEFKCSVKTIRNKLIKYNILIRTKSEAMIGINLGKRHGNYKDGRTNKKYYCKICKIRITRGSKLGFCSKCGYKIQSKKLKGRKFTQGHKKNLSLAKGGSGIPHENDNLAYSIRHLFEYIQWRTQVFKQDNFTCQECGQVGHQLEAHHIKGFSKLLSKFLNKYSQFNPTKDKETLLKLALNYKPFWKLNNGQTLCKDCHKITDNYRNKQNWRPLIKE